MGRVVVLFFPKLNKQHYYQQHRQQVAVLEVSREQRLVASAESGDDPEIHIWDSRSLLTLARLKGLHREGVTMLRFLKGERELLSVSSGVGRAPLIIVNL